METVYPFECAQDHQRRQQDVNTRFGLNRSIERNWGLPVDRVLDERLHPKSPQPQTTSGNEGMEIDLRAEWSFKLLLQLERLSHEIGAQDANIRLGQKVDTRVNAEIERRTGKTGSKAICIEPAFLTKGDVKKVMMTLIQNGS